MKNYDFGNAPDRRGTYSEKWDVEEGELPMWVADMDFRIAPEIEDALDRRLHEGVLGYTQVPKEWSEAYMSWWGRRHGLKMAKEELVYSRGVIPTISSSVRRLTAPNENVVLLTPVYNIFYNCVENNGRRVLECPLVLEDGKYVIDFADLEGKLSDPQTSMMIVCNPHNPVGRIWERDELAHIGELCAEHGVTVISDEVHCDITDPGKRYVPFASASETCRRISITTIAPTKCFNIAGVQTSAAFVPDPALRHKVWRQLNTDECGEPNCFAIDATIAAFGRGEGWLDAMNAYVRANKDYALAYAKENIPGIRVMDTEATYLLWIDCRDISAGTEDLAGEIRRETGLFLSDGSIYGLGGRGFLRMNMACPRSFVEDGMDRLRRAVSSINNRKSR